MLTDSPRLQHLLRYDLHQHSLPSSSIEFPTEDLLPRPKIQLPFRYGDHYLASQDLPLYVCVGIVFPGIVVPVPAHRLVGRHLLTREIMADLGCRIVQVACHNRVFRAHDQESGYAPISTSLTYVRLTPTRT